ncbi:MAG: helix-turn-helix domain-containing protein, partial [Candidatus Contendobacter sp.]|nr:helix-turn-helix domain-containing protein [Candidatus Contendobacter sp.]
VVGFLLQLADVAASDATECELPASKYVIASRLNLTPETLSRILHNLTEFGLIVVKGKKITVLDAEQLKQFNP